MYPYFKNSTGMELCLYKWQLFFIMWLAALLANAQEVAKTDSTPPYKKLYDKAVKLIDSSKYKEALPLLKKAIKEKPDYWDAFNKSAFAKIKLKEYKEAAKDLDKAEYYSPMNFETAKLKGINFYLDGKFNESKVALDTAISIAKEEKTDDAELFYYQALLMFKGKSYKTALQACESATEINPKYWEAMFLKGQIRFAMKDYNYAIREISDAIKAMPAEKTDYNTYKLRAKSRFEVKDYKGAVTDWNVYLDAIPEEEEALISRAAAKINTNDNSGAIPDLDLAIKLSPKNPVAYCYRGIAKGGNKNYIEALKDLDFAIKLKFDYGAAFVNRAAIKMASKDKRGACEDLEKADSLGDELAIRLIEQYCK
jgi:tetratricopeptide (TPR) repeat protein